MWVGIIKLILSITSGLIAYVDKKQLLDAGAARSAEQNLQQALKDIRKADAARRSAAYVPDELHNDVYNRDNKKPKE